MDDRTLKERHQRYMQQQKQYHDLDGRLDWREGIGAKELVIVFLILLVMCMIILPVGSNLLGQTHQTASTSLARNVYVSIQTVMLESGISDEEIDAFQQRFSDYRILDDLGKGKNDVERQIQSFYQSGSIELDQMMESRNLNNGLWGKAGSDYDIKVSISGRTLESVFVREHRSKKFYVGYDGENDIASDS